MLNYESCRYLGSPDAYIYLCYEHTVAEERHREVYAFSGGSPFPDLITQGLLVQ